MVNHMGLGPGILALTLTPAPDVMRGRKGAVPLYVTGLALHWLSMITARHLSNAGSDLRSL